MVIVLSNLRDEDDEDLHSALKLLRQQHLVVFAALKEEVFEKTYESDSFGNFNLKIPLNEKRKNIKLLVKCN